MLFRLSLVFALLAAAGCSRQRTSVAVDAALLTQVPSDTVALGAMRVKALRKTTAWQKLLAQPGVNSYFDRLAEETSFDPRKDLWEVLWSTDGKDPLVYARGEFAPMGLEPKIECEGIQRMNYKGSMLLGDGENAVWFVNSSTGIYGRTERLHRMIDERGTAKVGPAEALREQINGLPPDSHFWMVAEPGAFAGLSPAEGNAARNVAANLPKLLQSVRMLTMHASLTDGVALELTATCKDEAGARQVHDSLRGLLGLARFAMPPEQRAAFLPVLDGVDVTQKQTLAALKARMTTSQLEAIQAALPARGKEKAGE